jgi:hypothetical protein
MGLRYTTWGIASALLALLPDQANAQVAFDAPK